MSRNNNRKKKTDLKTLVEVIFIILDAATLGTIFVFIGHDAGGPLECTSVNGLCKHDNTSLGTWKNFPSAPCCGIDGNELMFNSSYRGLLVTRSTVGVTGVTVGLSVGCITPSNTVGATLQLQYANYSDASHTNTTNFVNIGQPVFIDNSANWPCGGTLEALGGALPNINGNPIVFIFRTMGAGGGGTGDNPRFSSVSVYVLQTLRRNYEPVIAAHGLSSFSYQEQLPFAVAINTNVITIWHAMNVTGSTQCGLQLTATSHCWESGTSTCTINAGTANCATTTVNYAVAFTGTVEVTLTPTAPGGAFNLPIGTISLLLAQTLTV